MHHDSQYTLPNLEWLRAFVAFAEHGSFTHAARALHLSQPALHVQVKKLAEQLRVTLYRRRGRVLELTDEGRRVLAFGRELLDRSARFVDALHEVERARPVVLAAGEGAFLYLLGDAVRDARRSGITLRALVRDAEGTVEAVRTGEAHVGVAALDEPPAELDARRLARAGAVLVVPEGHRLAGRTWIRVEDLAGEPLIVPPRGRPQREALERAARQAGSSLTVAVEALGWPLTVRLVELRVGVAIVNTVVRLDRGLHGVAVRGLPEQTYWALRRTGARSAEADRLWACVTARETPTARR